MAQDELNRFLETAQELQIKGLHNNEKGEGKRKQENEVYEINSTESFNTDYSEVKFESLVDLANDLVNSDSDLIPIEKDKFVLDPNQELDLQIDQMIEKNEGFWHCKVCRRKSNSKRDLRRHTKTHIEGLSYICNVCNKVLSTRNALRQHKQNIHKDSLLLMQ